jgi:hypothetical protein
MPQGQITELIKFIKQASPVIWQAAYRQVYVGVWASVVAILLAIGAWLYLWTRMSQWEPGHPEKEVCYLILLGFLLALAIALVCQLSHLANPDWYAIQLLLGSVK